MKEFIKNNSATTAWLLSGFVTSLSIFVWGDQLNWDFSSIGNYQIFPLLGLLAFSLMWTHYIMAALRVWSGYDKDSVASYRKYTSYVVLVAILLHPALLIYQLNSDGFGLPPASFESYVGTAATGFVMLGMIAWLAFILYEFKSKLHNKSWWKYVLMFNALALLLIVFHALELGQHLQSGWYKTVWIGYALSLLISYGYLLGKRELY